MRMLLIMMLRQRKMMVLVIRLVLFGTMLRAQKLLVMNVVLFLMVVGKLKIIQDQMQF